jgi:hypothetical protein
MRHGKRLQRAMCLALLAPPVTAAPQGPENGFPVSPAPALTAGAHAAAAAPGKVQRDAPPLYAPGTAPPRLAPMALADAHRLFYFESDGQRVTALDRDGHILWSRNPVEEAGVQGFRQDGRAQWPAIIAAGPPLAWMIDVMRRRGAVGDYLLITFNTKDFGLLDRHGGAFTPLGSD